jgi:hypothetical protein
MVMMVQYTPLNLDMSNVPDVAVQSAARLGAPPFDTYQICSARVNNTSTYGISFTVHNRDLTACTTETELVPVDFEEPYPVPSYCIVPSRPKWCDLPWYYTLEEEGGCNLVKVTSNFAPGCLFSYTACCGAQDQFSSDSDISINPLKAKPVLCLNSCLNENVILAAT